MSETVPPVGAALADSSGTFERRVVARNAAASSANNIHSDEGARALGYEAALVSGNALYCYLAFALSGACGPDWLSQAGVTVQFRAPVYDGDRLVATVESGLTANGRGGLRLSKEGGEVAAATGLAWRLSDDRPDVGHYQTKPLPPEPVLFDEGAVLDSDRMGSLDVVMEQADIDAYLTGIGEDPGAHTGTVPSAFLARMYALLMSANFVRPWPSIHVSSDLRHYRQVRVGEHLSVRGRIDKLFGRRGNRYYVLDMAWVDDHDAVVMTALHTGIYRIGHSAASEKSH